MTKIGRKPLRVQAWVDERDEWLMMNELKLYSANYSDVSVDVALIKKRHERKKSRDRNRKLSIGR